MGRLKIKKIKTKKEKRNDKFMEQIALMALMHFPDFNDINDLHCFMCEDFKNSICSGKDLIGDDVFDCMAAKVANGEGGIILP